MRVSLSKLAFARSGDKGSSSNVGVVAFDERCYEVLVRQLTTDVMKRHFAAVCNGPVERYELPNLRALNFILHQSLEDGAATSLRTDAQGKIHGLASLLIEIDVPDGFPLPTPRT